MKFKTVENGIMWRKIKKKESYCSIGKLCRPDAAILANSFIFLR
jgi:hypothetical protein